MNMNQHNQPQKRKNFITNSFKFLLAAASIAGTVGLWGVFSKKDAQTSSATLIESPLPTITTLVSVDPSAFTAASATDSSISTLPVVSQPTTSYSNSTSVQVLPPAVTNTRSSRP
jgi:hypothetical protein